MRPLVAILIPSRGRVEGLRRTIRSIQETAHPSNYEIRVKFDSCDLESVEAADSIRSGNTHVMIGPRLNGYSSLEVFTSQMADESSARWIWVLNDDVTIEGHGWDEQLCDIPTSGFIVQPEVYQLNESRYPHCNGGAFPVVPNGCWKRDGVGELKHPSDTNLDLLLRVEKGWQTRWLKGVVANHQRTEMVPE